MSQELIPVSAIGRVLLRFFWQTSLALLLSIGIALGLAWGFGPPPASGYSSLPTVFFLSGFPMIIAGGTLSFAMNTADTPRRKLRLSLPLIFGAIFLGWQSYAVWCLSLVQADVQNGRLLIVILFATAHLLCVFAVFLLFSFAYAQSLERSQPENEETQRQDRFLFLACAVGWYLLGMGWVGLLCLFAVLT